MRGVILQPNYIPWAGYFELINTSDIFVFLDDVQYTRRDWRNRNKIKTENESKWLTVPVIKQNRESLLIKDVMIDNTNNWRRSHYDTLKRFYSNAPYWELYQEFIDSMYLMEWGNLCELDIAFIVKISNILKLNTKFVRSSSLMTNGTKEEKLISICKELGISTYVSGPSGKNYINDNKFAKDDIELEYHEYATVNYDQLYGDFNPFVTVLDLLFNCGNDSSNYVKGI